MEATHELLSQQTAEPFWQRIKQFFRLPLDRAVLARIGGLSAALFVAWLLLPLGSLGAAVLWLAAIVVIVVGAAYGFRIIERSSRGYLIPSDYPLTDQSAVSPLLPYKFAGLTLAFAAVAAMLAAIAGRFDILVLLFWSLAFAVVLPAVTTRLVMTGSLRSALSPPDWLNVVERIGKPYAVLGAFVFLGAMSGIYGGIVLGAFRSSSSDGSGAVFSAALLAFLMSAGFWFVTYAICALIGYAIYQYADQLQISVMGRGGERLKSSTGRHADVKARTRDVLIGQMLTQGEIKEAIDLLGHDLAQRPNDLSLHARLHKLLLAENYLPRVEDHTDRYIALLANTQNWREALELVEEALARRADWTPRKVESIAPLARAALQKGKPQLAATLIRGFDRKHPNHPDIPQIYFVGAQLMAESGGKPAEGRRILEYLLQKYATDPVAAEAKRYLEVMDRMASGARGR